MPEQQDPNGYIVKDPVTRLLLTTLLSRWDDAEGKWFADYVSLFLRESASLAQGRSPDEAEAIFRSEVDSFVRKHIENAVMEAIYAAAGKKPRGRPRRFSRVLIEQRLVEAIRVIGDRRDPSWTRVMAAYESGYDLSARGVEKKLSTDYAQMDQRTHDAALRRFLGLLKDNGLTKIELLAKASAATK